MSTTNLIISGAITALALLLSRDASAGAPAPAPKTAAVKGPVKLELEVVNGSITVSTSDKKEVSVTAGCPVELDVDDDEVDVEVEEFGPGSSPCGVITIVVPTGSKPDLSAVNGGITLKGSFGDVEVEAVNGHVDVDRAKDVRVEAVNGGVTVANATGHVRIESVSGAVKVATTGPAPDVRLEAVSGSLSWSGACEKGCRINAETFAGNVELAFAPTSAFLVEFESHAGKLKDLLGVTMVTEDKDEDGDRVRGTFGKNPSGSVSVETYSGSLTLKKK